MPSRRAVLSAGVTLTVTLAGCFDLENDDAPATEETPTPHPVTESGPQTPDWETTGSPLDADLVETTIVENLEIPWDIAFGPEDAVITERPGRIRRLTPDILTGETPVDATTLPEASVPLPNLDSTGEGGLLGVTLHPTYPTPAFVYLYYTANDERRINRVVRYDATADTPVLDVVVDTIPAGPIHNGGRIAIGPDDALWICTGDADDPDSAQQPSSLAGTVSRVAPNGEPLETDTLPVGGDPRLYSYGHRNVQGIGWLPDGTPITTEHGPAAHDEVNLLWPGGNYGWPIARGGAADRDTDSYGDHPEFVPPVASSGADTTWAPSGGVWYDGNAVPELQNRFLFAGLESARLHVLTLLEPGTAPPADATAVADADWLDDRYLAVRHELLVGDYGRIRHIAQSPDGVLYLLTSNRDGRASGRFPQDGDDRIVRLESA